jgi:hypothetical protein
VRVTSRESEKRSCHFIGGRRLGAWEAVVFGEPHVENALASGSGDGYSVSFLCGEKGVSGYADSV